MRADFLSLAAAALVGAAAGFLCQPDLGVQPALALTIDAPAAEAENRRLALEVATLRDQLACLRTEQDRTAFETSPGEQRPAVDPTDTRLLERLLRELAQQQNAGNLRQYFTGRMGELAELLMRVWMETGSPQLAFQLLTEVGARLEDIDGRYPGVIVQKLRAAVDPRAHEASLYALGRNIEDGAAIDDLLKTDPNAALAALDAYALAHADDAEAVDSLLDERLRLLLALRRPTDALPVFDALLAKGRADEQAWRLLIAAAPAAAVERLQAKIGASREDDDTVGLRLQLASAQLAAGDRTAARRGIEALLASHPGHEGAIAVLAKFDKAAARALMQRQAEESPSPRTWTNLARQLLADGQAAEGQAALWNSYLAAADDTENQQRVVALASPELAERILQHARTRENRAGMDELLGDVGEVYWRSGQTERAIAVWREARQLDPTDSEWQTKLQRVAAGQDPLGATVNGSWWRSGDDW